MKKQEQRGLNVRIGMMGGAGALWEKRANLPTIHPQYQGTPELNPSLALNYRSGATNTFLQADWLYAPTLNKNEFATRTYADGTVIEQQVKRNRRTDYTTVNAGVDRAFNASNTLVVSGLFNHEKILDDGDNPYFTGSLQNRTRLWQFLEDEVKYTGFGSAVFTHRFRQPGHSLAITSNYSFHREDERYTFTNTLPTFTGMDAFKLLSDEHVVDLNADYIRPRRQGRIGSRFAHDVGLRKPLKNGRAELTINDTDVLNTNQAQRTIRGSTFTMVSTDYLETQVVRVGYTRKF